MINYLTIGILSSIIALVMAWMFISSRTHYLIKIVLTGFVVAAMIYNWMLFSSILGYPVNEYPPDKSFIIAGFGVKKLKVQYLWIVDVKGPKAYSIPFNEAFANKLAKAQEEAKKRGGFVQYHRPGSDDSEGKGKGGQGGNGTGNGGDSNQPKKDGKSGGKPGTGSGDSTGFTDDSEGSSVTVVSPLPSKDD